MLNWIVWNRTVYMYENRFGINNLQWLMCHKTKQNQTSYILSSSRHADCIGSFDSFLPAIPINHWSKQSLMAPSVHTDLMSVSFCWSANTGVSMCRSPFLLKSLSLLHQQCLACLAQITRMIYEMGGKLLYSCCFVECCFQRFCVVLI